MNTALLYAIFAMAGSVFYRELTKFNGFTAKTTLSGIAGIGHILLGIGIVLLLVQIRRSVSAAEE